ncbi:MAG: YceI family protein [Pseudomonadota bacterium]
MSVKAGEVGESHFFRTVTGNVSPEGEVRLEIPLEAVETRVEIRNERMKSMFFDTQTYPKAILTATIPVDEYENLSVGERQPASIDGQLSLHGMLVDLSSEIFVSRLSDDKVVVETSEPVILDVVSFGLGDGLAALQEIAGLPSISPAVPVSASIVFTQ